MKNFKSIISCALIICILSAAFVSPCVDAKADGITLPDITASMLKTDLQTAVSGGHPYIVANSEQFDRVREYAFGKDEIITAQYKLIKDKATALLDKPCIKIQQNLSNSSYIGNAITYWNNIMCLGMVWQVEGIDDYAECAWEQTEIFCDMSTWGTFQMIDNVQVAFGVALCYDWFYDWLSSSQKTYLVNALKTKHLNTVKDVYNNPGKSEYQVTFYRWLFSNNNHTIMDNSLTFLAAMAIADTGIDFSVDIMDHALECLEPTIKRWYPDSAWFEGLGYWGWAGPYMARLLLTMKNAFGHCYGYDDIDCLVNAADFPIYAQSSQGAFIWNDMDTSIDQLSPIIYAFGVLKNDVALQKFALDRCDVADSVDPVFCLEYNPKTNYGEQMQLSLDKHFRDVDLVTMRSSFNTDQEIWCGMAVQESRSNNGMMNSGTLALDALGERWIMNHGYENYYSDYWDQDRNRWNYYRTRAEGNSCIVIDPSKKGGQNVDSKDIIDTFVSGEDGAYAISDLTETYSGQVSSYKRGISLTNNRRSFVVQDELTLSKNANVYSFFNIYKADIEILSDKKSAIISKGNKKLYVEVYSDRSFEFSVMDCEPLPTSPTPSNPNSPNPDFQKLAIYFSNIGSANIRVSFTPYLCDEELDSVKGAAYVPLAGWSVHNSADVPKLSSLMVNGSRIDGFHPDTRYYEVVGNSGLVSVTASANEALYDVRVEADNANKLHKIIVSDKANPTNVNSYIVDFSGKTSVVTPSMTYIHSSFGGVMKPQEFYRIELTPEHTGMLFVKDTAPQNLERAVLTIYAKSEGKSVNTQLRTCSFSWDKDLIYLSYDKAPVRRYEDCHGILNSSVPSVYGSDFVKVEYDITSLIPEGGGDYNLGFVLNYMDRNFLSVASPMNSSAKLRPKIKYYYR